MQEIQYYLSLEAKFKDELNMHDSEKKAIKIIGVRSTRESLVDGGGGVPAATNAVHNLS